MRSPVPALVAVAVLAGASGPPMRALDVGVANAWPGLTAAERSDAESFAGAALTPGSR